MTNRPDLNTLQYVLYQYITQANSLKALVSNTTNSSAVMAGLATAATATSIRMSVTVVVVLPVMLIYPFFQRFCWVFLNDHRKTIRRIRLMNRCPPRLNQK